MAAGMKKVLSVILAVILLISGANVSAFAADDGDVTAPVIKSLKFENADAIEIDKLGNGMNATIELVEEGTGVEEIQMIFKDSQGNSVSLECLDIDINALFTGKHKISLHISEDSSFKAGKTYTLDYMGVVDRIGNATYYQSNSPAGQWNNISRKITVKKCLRPDQTQTSSDKTPPVLNFIKIHNADNLDTTKTIKADIYVTENGSGVSSMSLSYLNLNTGNVVSINTNNRYELRTGYHTIEFDTGKFELGTYELMDVFIYDNADNDTHYQFSSPDWNKIKHEITVTKKVQPLKVNGLRIVKWDIVSPDFVEIEVDIQQGSSKLDFISGNIVNNDSNSVIFFYDKLQPESGKQIVKVPVEMFCRVGLWHLSELHIRTKDGLSYSYDDEEHGYGSDILSFTDIPGYKYQNIRIHNLYDPVFFGSLENIKKALKEVKKMKAGEAVVLDCRYEHNAPKELFTAIAGKDKTLIFQDENVQWIFNGKTIKKSRCKDIWLRTEVSVRSGQALGYPDEKKVVQVQFAENGKLPGKATIRINNEYLRKKYIKDDDNLILSYYDEGTPEVLDKGVALAADGYTEIKITHNSTYLLSRTMPRLVAPKKVKVNAAGCTVKMSWSKVSGASGYKIYRSTSAIGTFKKIATVKGNRNTSYTDTTVKPGQKYYYRVRGYVSGKNIKCTYSKCVDKRVGTGEVRGVTANRLSRSQTKISWKKVNGVTGYKVYYSPRENGTYKLLKTTESTFLKTGKVIKGCYIKIRAYKKVGKEIYYGQYSAAVKL